RDHAHVDRLPARWTGEQLHDSVHGYFPCSIANRMMASTTATMASPAISPDASGVPSRSARFGFTRSHSFCRMPPSTIVKTTAPGTTMPIPIPVGGGVHLLYLCSDSVHPTPRAAPVTKAPCRSEGSVDSPPTSSSAKPCQRTDAGADRPPSPPTP